MLTKDEKSVKYDKMIEDRKKYHFRRQVRIDLTLTKAYANGIFVTPKEVDDEIRRREDLKSGTKKVPNKKPSKKEPKKEIPPTIEDPITT